MRNLKKLSPLIVGITLTLASCSNVQDIHTSAGFWYDEPADEWMTSLPVGNGRLGAMVYGGVESETLALNESTLWSGEYDANQERPFGRKKLDELRQIFFDGKLVEGNRIASENLSGTPHSFGTHLPMGDLNIHFTYPSTEKAVDYKRELDMKTAVSTISYKVGDVKYTRQCLASNPDDVIVYRISADKKNTINIRVDLDLLREANITSSGNQLIYTGKVDFPMHGKGGVNFNGRVSVASTDGQVSGEGNMLNVAQASEVTLLLDIRTDYTSTVYDGADYKERCESTIASAASKSFEELKQKHVSDYAPLFDRVSLTLGNGENDAQPTDERWAKVKNGASDPGLEALFFQYGRYLLIASSRANSPLPVALQGFFNDNLACNMSWTNDYHLDINTQQNYWIANVGNLAECNAPLFRYIEDLSVHGSQTAKVVYGCKGWTAHTTANTWGYTSPSSSISWGLFPTAGSWIASHLWTEYEYTQNRTYLEKVAYPLLKGNAEFLLDYMVIHPKTGHLVTGPSISPENGFLYDGHGLSASIMPTCDRELAYEIFQACISASDVLNMDRDFADSLRIALAQLPPIPVSSSGAVQEWYDDFEEAHPNHRHTSHLLALYPYSQITLEKTPQLAAAARKTIENRLAAKDWEDTEWSRANMICFYARLKDAELAYNSVKTLIGGFTRENLLSISPKGIALAPYDIFIFDGNAAGAAGIAEILVQNHEGYIELLPCLPKEWKDGSYNGLCVRGGAEVSVDWKDGVVQNVLLKATASNNFRMKLPQGKNYSARLNGKDVSGEEQSVKISQGFIDLSMKTGDKLELR